MDILNNNLAMILISVGIVFVVSILFQLVRLFKLYKKVPPNYALVRSGDGNIKVAIQGGIISSPENHNLVEVILEPVSLVLNLKNDETIRTTDNINPKASFTLILKVNNEEENIIKASENLAKNKKVDANSIEATIKTPVYNAIKKVVSENNLNEIRENQSLFIRALYAEIETILISTGLELECIELDLESF